MTTWRRACCAGCCEQGRRRLAGHGMAPVRGDFRQGGQNEGPVRQPGMRQDQTLLILALNDVVIGEKVEIEGARGVALRPAAPEARFDGVKRGEERFRAHIRLNRRGRVDERRIGRVRPGRRFIQRRHYLQVRHSTKCMKCP